MASIRPEIADEQTPVDHSPIHDPFEMLSKKLDDVAADTKLAVTEAREANQMSAKAYELLLELNTHNKRVDQRLTLVETYHLWLPGIAVVLSVVALLLTLLRVK